MRVDEDFRSRVWEENDISSRGLNARSWESTKNLVQTFLHPKHSAWPALRPRAWSSPPPSPSQAVVSSLIGRNVFINQQRYIKMLLSTKYLKIIIFNICNAQVPYLNAHLRITVLEILELWIKNISSWKRRDTDSVKKMQWVIGSTPVWRIKSELFFPSSLTFIIIYFHTYISTKLILALSSMREVCRN